MSLTYALSNGQRVEIITVKEGGPSRDWLNPALGYLKTNRARAKVRQWFNNRQLDEAIANAVKKASKTLHNLRWFQVTDTRGEIENGKVAHWQVTMKVGFTLD